MLLPVSFWHIGVGLAPGRAPSTACSKFDVDIFEARSYTSNVEYSSFQLYEMCIFHC